MRIWRVIWLIGQLGLLVHGTHHQHDHLHAKFSELQKRESAVSISGVAPVSTASVAPVPQATADAAEVVARALRVLKTRNKLRLEHVQYNKYEVGTTSEVHPALDSSPLDYSQRAVKEAESSEERLTRRHSESTEKYGYSIPDELREAAKIIAESTPPSPSAGNHSAIAALMDEKYGTGIRDTYVPPQAYHAYNGLSQIVLDENDSMLHSRNDTEGDLKKRASSSWWMATMAQRGSSPYAPSGYKVS
jgi:hypothetical protein